MWTGNRAQIFYRLGAVKAGETVTVPVPPARSITFVVDKVASDPKDQFPTEAVCRGDLTQSEIQLVTCGGTFDRVQHYLDTSSSSPTGLYMLGSVWLLRSSPQQTTP